MGSRIPREHDRVTAEGHNGVLAVVSVDDKTKTVDLQFVTGDGPVVTGVPWTALHYMDEEDANPAAARESTEK